MFVAYRRTPLWRITTSFSLVAVLGIALAFVPGCTSSKKSSGKASDVTSEKKAPTTPVPSSSAHASYGVSWMNGTVAGEGTYNLAYVMKGTAPLVIDDQTTGFKAAEGTGGPGDAARSDPCLARVVEQQARHQQQPAARIGHEERRLPPQRRRAGGDHQRVVGTLMGAGLEQDSETRHGRAAIRPVSRALPWTRSGSAPDALARGGPSDAALLT